ncbi:hypothetical protein HPP92_024889 [Vanilla planifolia]|uniref:Uncharacterized protein n=1 Tax=Vanilla planifolia TaxID=51239 RepID=A0A835PJK1_VANPL|nr:hypothetical protein HPP92_025174 [Vanilla planifolia]KAG0453585.1 hypothetical protein HPP92_024889 [Vanilla planifolia]
MMGSIDREKSDPTKESQGCGAENGGTAENRQPHYGHGVAAQRGVGRPNLGRKRDNWFAAATSLQWRWGRKGWTVAM